MAKPSSDFNLKSVNTEELFQHLTSTIEFGGKTFVVGRRGSGKSSICKQAIAHFPNHQLLYWNMSVMERADIIGYPNLLDPNRKSKYISYLYPAFFKPLFEGEKSIVLLLDEVDKIDQSLCAPLLEIIEEFSINGCFLPNLKAVLMTGNLQAEGGRRPPLPLLDRSEKYLLEPSFKYWARWAGKANIHPSIISYLFDHQADLVGDVDPGDAYSDASPRGWENSSKIAHYGEKHEWNSHLITAKVAGFVGKAAGIRYAAYFDHYQVLLPWVERILKGDKTKDFHKLKPSEQIVAIMILCSRTGKILDELRGKKEIELPSSIKAVGKFLLSTDEEMALLGLRAGIGSKNLDLIEQNKDFSELLDKLQAQLGN
jgi:energy-coupling factor transporter ATP-binding protein EcfA2